MNEEELMTARIPADSPVLKDIFQAMYGLKAVVRRSTLPSALMFLVKIRVSQINGCGRCIDMHTKDARLEGESEQRLYLLSAWREAPIYSQRERAALAWAEAVTEPNQGGVPDSVYEVARKEFDEQELLALTLGVIEINGWNRIVISLKFPVGDYVAGSLAQTHAV
jgi:AhpD family alkylhydroperoxidase